MKREALVRYVIFLLLLSLALATRFLPHPPNFTAVGAAALFAGAMFPKRWGVFLPLGAMVVSDLFIGFHSLILFTWGGMAIHGLIGWWVLPAGRQVRRGLSPGRVVLGSVLASTQFFLLTNWAVWKFGTMYAPDLSGLFQSYVAALPFFRNSLLGDLWYVGLLFGVYAAASELARRLNRPIAVRN